MTDQVVAPVAPTLTAAEQAALAKVDTIHSPTNPQPVSVVTSGFMGGKYATASDMEAAFKSLQAEYTKVKQGVAPAEAPQVPAQAATDASNTPAPTTDLTIVKPEVPVTPEAAAAAVEGAGLDFNKYSTSMAANGGKLTEADYTELGTKGIDRAMVDTYLKGIQASAQAEISRAHVAAGSEQNFNAARAWAGSNFSDAEMDAFNGLATKGGASLELAVSGLVSKWQAAVGKEGTLVLGKQTVVAGNVYANQREMVDAMKDPRYNKDAAYTREVTEKASRSKW